jgi:hypothetical protein
MNPICSLKPNLAMSSRVRSDSQSLENERIFIVRSLRLWGCLFLYWSIIATIVLHNKLPPKNSMVYNNKHLFLAPLCSGQLRFNWSKLVLTGIHSKSCRLVLSLLQICSIICRLAVTQRMFISLWKAELQKDKPNQKHHKKGCFAYYICWLNTGQKSCAQVQNQEEGSEVCKPWVQKKSHHHI